MVKSDFNLLVLRQNLGGLQFSEIVKQNWDSFSFYADPCILYFYDEFFAGLIKFARDGDFSSIRKPKRISRQIYYGLLQPSHIGDKRVWTFFIKNRLDVYLFLIALESEHLNDFIY